MGYSFIYEKMVSMKSFYKIILLLTFICSCDKIDDNIEITNKLKEGNTEESTIEKTLTVFLSSSDVGYEGDVVIAQIKSNCDWTVSTDATWCHSSVEEGNGDHNLYITVDKNNSNTVRSATIVIIYESQTAELIIVQQASPYRSPDGNDNTPPSW